MGKHKKYHISVDEKNRQVSAVQKHRPDTLVHFVAKQFGISEERRNQYVFNKEHGIEDFLDTTLRLDKLFIASEHKAVVTCDPRDTFDANVGTELAIARLNGNVARAKEKAITRWQAAMAYKLIKISSGTFGAAYDKAITKLIDEGEINLESKESPEENEE